MLNLFLKCGGLLLLAWAGYKVMIVFSMRNFKASAFQGQWFYLSTDLLRKLDAFADALQARGHSVSVSPAAGAVMRFATDPIESGVKNSQHYLGRAIDIMLPDGLTLKEAYDIAVQIGFTGIGVYPDWKPYKGMHLDIRLKTLRENEPDNWAGLVRGGKLVYVGLQEGFYA